MAVGQIQLYNGKFLVTIPSKTRDADPMFPSLFSLYLDEFDDSWTSKIHEFDYVIVSAGHWFFRPAKYFMNSQLIGCHYCADKNVTQLDVHYSYRKAFRTAFRAINSLKNSIGLTFLRTFAPSHFENGEWNKGGDCVRRKPFMSNETRLGGTDLELFMAQVEEFKVAESERLKRGLKFRLLDTTNVMLLRPEPRWASKSIWALARSDYDMAQRLRSLVLAWTN